LPSLYINEIEVIQLAASMLLFAAVFQIPDGVQVSAIGALRGVQDVKVPAILTFIAYILIGLPTGYFLAFVLEFSYAGIWLGLLTGLSLSALFNTIRFFRIQRYIFPVI
jgi:MATE family multidrug resistance protein